MTRLLLSVVIAGGSFQLACGDTPANGPGAGGAAGSSSAGTGGASLGSSGSGGAGGNAVAAGGSGGTGGSAGGSAGAGVVDAGVSPPDANVAEPATHLGKPFTIVNGVISAESNDYGLEASLYVGIAPLGTTVTTSSTDGELCFNGTAGQVVNGDYANYWGMVFGFGTPSATDPQVPPWDLDGGRVLGISATVAGETIPRRLGFLAEPAREGEPVLAYGNCDFVPLITASGQVAGQLFTDLYNQCWDPSLRPGSAWQAEDPVHRFGWQVSSDDIGDNPFDFCLTDIRPILAGAGPDEPADPVRDAGPDAAGE